MAITFGFYNSQNGDRVYDAVQMSSIFDGLVNNGVYASIGDLFVVNPGTGLAVTVGTGRAWFNHTWTLNDAVLSLPVTLAEVLQDRIDAVVIEVDSTNRENTIKIIDGTPDSSNPVPPTMNQNKPDATPGVWQYPLAYLRVNKGVTAITQANITNMVGSTACPFVTGIVQVTSLDALLGQWRGQLDEFEASMEDDITEWFESVSETIVPSEPDTYLNLYNMIQQKQNALTFDSTPTPNSTNPVTSDGIASAIANAVDFRISMGTAAPSGGSDGDIYFQYNA